MNPTNRECPNELPHAVIVTGGIASGKSSAMKIFRSKGFECIDADHIAHHLLQKQAPKIKQLWGDKYINDDHTVNRSLLADLIFSDTSAKLVLEKLLHPLIRQELWIQSCELEKQQKMYFVEIPLFFESKNYILAESLLIYAPQSIQIERLMRRSKINENQAMQRINNQLDIEQKKLQATYIIDNSKTPVELRKNCANFLRSKR